MQERQKELIALDMSVLAAMIAPCAPGRPLATAEALSGGFSNSNYRVHFADDAPPLVVRLHSGNPASAPIEWAVHERLRERVPMPELLLVERDAARFGFPYSVLSWVEGERLSDLLVTGDAATIGALAFAVGRVLATIHSVRFAQGGFLGPDLAVRVPFGSEGGWEAAINGWAIQGQGRRWLGEERAVRLARLVHDHGDEVARDPSSPALLHADYNGKNLLVRQDSQGWVVAAVLDWEFAFAGSPLFDLGIFLRGDAELPPSYASEFVRGYQFNGGTLPPNWRRLSRLLDLLNLCQFLDTPVERPVLFAEVLRRIDATLELFAA